MVTSQNLNLNNPLQFNNFNENQNQIFSALPNINQNYKRIIPSPSNKLNNGSILGQLNANGNNLNYNLNNYSNVGQSQIFTNFKDISTTNNSNFRILSQETKINELETKLIVLEQNNFFLLDQLKNYERNFEIQISKFNQITENERENRERIEKIFTLFSDQTSSNTSELKNKVNFIQETFEKEEKWKYEQRLKDFQVYKNILNNMTEKITETVKAEIDMRFKADIDIKTFTQNMGQKFMQQIDFLRKEMDDLSKEHREHTREVSKECSERSVNLSKYIDQIIAKAIEEPTKNYESLKISLGKLTEQVKNNMIFQNDLNKVFEEKLGYLNENVLKDKENKVIDVNDLEKRLEKKIKDLVLYLESILKMNSTGLHERIDNLSSNSDRNLKFIADQLIDTRKKLISKIHDLEENSHKEFISIIEDFEQVISRMDNYEGLLADYDNINKETKKQINKSIAEFQSKYETKFINEKMTRELENEEIKDLISKTNNDIIELGEITNNQLETMTKNFEKENNIIMHKYNLISDKIDEMNRNNFQIFDG